ncbi:hypothetical protein [Novosphingobium sp. M1R2S20]|uniref:Uncharacterized protein n=1 Tax=Novosphingobium rhizovicinum TaxID=3228928 RepID=A0ABV3R9C8_9SPHN
MQTNDNQSTQGAPATGDTPSSGLRPQKGGEAATTRFGMEDGDNTEVPATGTDPERQSPEKK